MGSLAALTIWTFFRAPWRLLSSFILTAASLLALVVPILRLLLRRRATCPDEPVPQDLRAPKEKDMSSLMAWVKAGLKLPRLIFLMLLVGVGAVSLGEVAAPARDYVRDLFGADGPEVSKVRSSFRDLQRLSGSLEGELSAATAKVCEAIAAHTRSADMVRYLEASSAKQESPERRAKLERLIGRWKAQMSPKDEDEERLAIVLEALYDVETAVDNLRTIEAVMKK